MSDELSRALDRISSTRKEASKLGDQLGRETNTLDERKYVRTTIMQCSCVCVLVCMMHCMNAVQCN